MSEIVACFETVRSSAPGRTLLYMPATGAEWSADDLWQAHQRYAERLTQMDVGSGDLVVSAAGNSAASVAFLLACRAVDAAVLPVDSGTTPHRAAGPGTASRRAGAAPARRRRARSGAGRGVHPAPRRADASVSRPRNNPPALPRGGGAEADVRVDERSESGGHQRSAADRRQRPHRGRHEYQALGRADGHHPGLARLRPRQSHPAAAAAGHATRAPRIRSSLSSSSATPRTTARGCSRACPSCFSTFCLCRRLSIGRCR